LTPNVALVTLGLVKPVPVIVTKHPTGPLVGVIDVIVGVAASAGAANPNTISAAPTNTPATRDPIFRFELIRNLAFRGQAAAYTAEKDWIPPNPPSQTP
jgi:hypothetical protein